MFSACTTVLEQFHKHILLKHYFLCNFVSKVVLLLVLKIIERNNNSRFYCLNFHYFQLQLITIELSRGWNSRLGFSLQGIPNTSQTIVSAIYSNSVAAKDGRLRVGDILLTVNWIDSLLESLRLLNSFIFDFFKILFFHFKQINDESVEAKSTAEIIDLLRIIRGLIVLVVKRPCLWTKFQK